MFFLVSNFQEALLLSSLRSELDKRGVPLYGILHEELGAERFKDYLKGDLFFDKEVRLESLIHKGAVIIVLYTESVLWTTRN